MQYVKNLKIESSVSERNSSDDGYFRLERDYYLFEAYGRSVTIIDEYMHTSDDLVEQLSIVIPGHNVVGFDIDEVDSLKRQLRLLGDESLIHLLVPSWLLSELVKAGLEERIEARAKVSDPCFIFVHNAKQVRCIGRKRREESEINLCVGNEYLGVAFIPGRYVRLDTDSDIHPKTCSWSLEWDRFIQSCFSCDEYGVLAVKHPLPQDAASFITQARYLARA